MKKYLNRLFIDGLSGMAYGLFSTLIIGTILCQIAKLFGGNVVGDYLNAMGLVAKTLTGAGIGVGVAAKLKASPLTTVSAAVAGMIGAFPTVAIQAFPLGAPGEPLGAFIAAYVAIELGTLVSGKTKVDIIVTPFVSILSGSIVGLLIGPSISEFMVWLGSLVNYNVEQNPILGGMLVSVLMGMILTLPISSAAIGVSLQLSGLAAGAATVGCCANMIGFAVASYRENKVGGLIAQGIGTSMLQVPNILKKPVIWLPAIMTSAILGPISTTLIVMTNNAVGSGMGTAGLVGPIMSYQTMVATEGAVVTLVKIAIMYFILPAILSLVISNIMREKNIIKDGDMKLNI